MKNMYRSIVVFLIVFLWFAPVKLVAQKVSEGSAGFSHNACKKDNTAPLKTPKKTFRKKIFPISLYKTTYIFPFYYTASPYSPNPEDDIHRVEMKFQISFKVPVLTNLFRKKIDLYVAYSQLSYWQAYNDSAFFRETNYEPEVFLEFPLNRHFAHSWDIPMINMGAVHQSNGKGNGEERSWNRLYAEVFLKNGNFVISLKPWWIVPSSVTRYNDNISDYLGHGRMLMSYHFHHQLFSLELRNNLESGFNRGAQQLSWSIPLTRQFRFYVQYFHGYGQSLIEYDHQTNAVGVGISLNDELAVFFPEGADGNVLLSGAR